MVKAQNKRVPPPKKPRGESRVWDKLTIALSERAIDRDIRIVQQKVLAMSSYNSLQCSQDTTGTMCSGNSVMLAHHPSSRGTARSKDDSEATPGAGHGPAPNQQQHCDRGGGSQQWRSRSSSPSFQFPPTMPAAATGAAAHYAMAAAKASLTAHLNDGAAPALHSYDTDTSASLGLAAVELGWDGCGLQHQQMAAAHHPAQYAYA